MPQHILYALPPGMTYEQAALVEPVSIAVHARNLTPIEPGDTALVFGAGLIGLMTVQVLKHTAAKQIIAVDIDDGKLQVAPRDGRPPRHQPQPGRRGGGGQGADRAAAAPTWPSRRWASRPPCARPSRACARAAR